MKKTTRSFLAFLLAMLICFSLLSCGEGTPSDTDTDTEADTEEITDGQGDDGMLKLVSQGTSAYRIVYPLLGNICISDAYT